MVYASRISQKFENLIGFEEFPPSQHQIVKKSVYIETSHLVNKIEIGHGNPSLCLSAVTYFWIIIFSEYVLKTS